MMDCLGWDGPNGTQQCGTFTAAGVTVHRPHVVAGRRGITCAFRCNRSPTTCPTAHHRSAATIKTGSSAGVSCRILILSHRRWLSLWMDRCGFALIWKRVVVARAQAIAQRGGSGNRAQRHATCHDCGRPGVTRSATRGYDEHTTISRVRRLYAPSSWGRALPANPHREVVAVWGEMHTRCLAPVVFEAVATGTRLQPTLRGTASWRAAFQSREQGSENMRQWKHIRTLERTVKRCIAR